MHRKSLLDQVADYRMRYPEECACIDAFEKFVAEHPDCFERSLAIGHVTGSAWVVNRDGTHTLLTHHRKLNRWLQPGGHADGNPSVMETAQREAREETGIESIVPVTNEIFDLDIHRIPARGEEAAHDHYDVRFAVRTTDLEEFTVSGESHALCWQPIDRLKEKTDEESMHRMQRKWRMRK